MADDADGPVTPLASGPTGARFPRFGGGKNLAFGDPVAITHKSEELDARVAVALVITAAPANTTMYIEVWNRALTVLRRTRTVVIVGNGRWGVHARGTNIHDRFRVFFKDELVIQL